MGREGKKRALGRSARRPVDGDALLFEVTTVAEPALTPDGSDVAYVVARVDRETLLPRSRIALRPIHGGRSRWLTRGPLDSRPTWSPDGRQLAFLRRGADGLAQVWLLNMSGGDARQLTRLMRGVTELAWRPNGGALAVIGDVAAVDGAPPSAGPCTRVVDTLYYRGDTLGWRAGIHRHLFLVDTATTECRQLTSGSYEHMTPVFSPDGKMLAFASTRSRQRGERMPFGYELCTMPAGGGKVTRVVADCALIGGIAWSDDLADIMVVISDLDAFWQPYLYRVRVRTGARERLSDDRLLPQVGFFPVVPPPPLVYVGRRVCFVADSRGTSAIYEIDGSGRLREVHSRQESIAGLSASTDGRRLAFVASQSSTPAEVVTLDRRAQTGPTRTTTNREFLGAFQPGRMRRFQVRRGDVSIQSRLLLPPGFDASRSYPCVLDIHGGPNSFFPQAFNPLHQLLAGRGYVVLYADPRGSTSYGESFARSVVGDWGGEDYRDLMAAVDRAAKMPFIDAERLGIHGYSYGGYMTAWAVGQTPRFGAAVVGAPVTNLVSMYGTTDIGASWGRQHWGGRPQDNLDWYLARSPITTAHRVRTPVLLLHGEDDHRCPIGQSEEYFVALKERNREVEMVRFPGCSHLFPRIGHPRLRREYMDRVVSWFDRWLRRR